jgi:hypothetical protein
LASKTLVPAGNFAGGRSVIVGGVEIDHAVVHN